MTRLPAALAVLVPALAGAALPPPPDRPAIVQLRGRTIFLPPEQLVAGVGEGWQLLQFLEISGRDLSTPGLSVHTAVWGGGAFDAEDRPPPGNAAIGDVDLLYVGYADPRGRGEIRVGRQLMMGGAAPGFYGQFDGGYGRVSTGLLEAEAFGGLRVVRAFDEREGDYLGGARVGLRRTGLFGAGLSFLHATTDGRLARQVAGADLNVRPLPWLDVVGAAAYDLVDPGLAEARALARFEPVHRLGLALAVEQGSPGRLVDKSSIFSVFSLGDWAQGELLAEYAITDLWLVHGRFGRVFFPDSDGAGLGGQASTYGGGVSTRVVRGLWLSLSGQRLPADENGYGSARLAARWTPDASWTLTSDLLAYFYDGPPLPSVSDATESYVAQLFVQRRLIAGFSVGVGAELASTAFTTGDFRGTLLATQELDLALGGAR